MSLGVCGSHRTGKTTLCEAFSNETDMPLVLTSTSKICKERGVDPAKPMSFIQRMDLQNAILDGLHDQWSKETIFVTDRTPIDCLMYTTADITTDVASTHADWLIYNEYAERCFDLTNQHFSTLVVLQPGITIVEDASKATAALSRSYMEHLNALAIGLAMDYRVKTHRTQIGRNVLSLDSRVEALCQAWQMSFKNNRQMLEKQEAAVH